MTVIRWSQIDQSNNVFTRHIVEGDTVQTVEVPLFDCVECGAPATWLVYRYASTATAVDFTDCSWACDHCKSVVERQCAERGWVSL